MAGTKEILFNIFEGLVKPDGNGNLINAVASDYTISDDKTVLVTVDSPNSELIYSFKAVIIPAGSGDEENAAPIGTGPFSFVSYVPQEGIVLAKHTELAGAFRIVSAPSNVVQALFLNCEITVPSNYDVHVETTEVAGNE